MNTETLLLAIIVLLICIEVTLSNISSRLKERFPTQKEQDHKWAMEDPMGHWEAHKDDKKLTKK